MNRYRIFVDFLIAMFGIASWIGVNAIYVQLPVLVTFAPEGWSLPSYIVVVIQIANLGPVFYALFRKFTPRLCNDTAWIFSLLILGNTAMGLLAFFYDVRTNVNGAEHSVALLILIFATALVGCSSSILFVPYLRNFHENHLASYFVGEGLSGVLPSAFTLIQGVGRNSACQQNTSNSTEFQPPLVSGPNFSPRIYFLLIFFILASSTCAFWLLNYLLAVRNQRISSSKESAHDSNIERPIFAGLSETLNLESAPSSIYSESIRGYLYVLMGFICSTNNGFLPGLQSYSCLPYGNVAYFLTVTLANISSPIACVLASWLPSRGLRGVNVISALIFVGTSYVTWLAFSSPTPPWRGTTFGVVLVVLAWVILLGLIAYTKLSITAIFRREPGDKPLFYLGMSTQIGSATGAILSFILVNYTNLLVSYNPCEPHV